MGEKKGISREALEQYIEITPYAKWIGARLIDFKEGEVSLEVPLRKELTQHHGFAHGAVVSFVADSAGAWAAASVAGDVVTSEYKLNLLAPGIGDKLIGRGYVLKQSSRQVVTRADVFSVKDGKERFVATCLATIAIFNG